jgi:phage repressor protein C with HTH and peptisase S24 domain
MPRNTKTIASLPWTHFLKRLYWFKLPGEDHSHFIARSGITKHNKSKWINTERPSPSTDMIERIAKRLKLTPEEQHWLTFGSAPLTPVPPCLATWRAPSPTQFARELVDLAAKLHIRRDQISGEDLETALLDTLTTSLRHASLAWSAMGQGSEPGLLYSSIGAAAGWIAEEIRALEEEPDLASQQGLRNWVLEVLKRASGEAPEIVSREAKGSANVMSLLGRRKVTDERTVDTARYFYIPKAEPRLAAGAGTLVISERSDDYYAFRLDWLNQVASSKGDLWLFEVVGDSMSTTLEHRDVVLIDCGRRTPVHDGIYAIEEENAVSIKRIRKRSDGVFWIVSDNRALQAAHKPLYPSRKLTDSVRIIGRMIWSARTWV